MSRIDKTLLYEFLCEQQVENLYHADTVETSCSMIREGGLLSRQSTLRKNLYLTNRDKDEIDKKYGIFNDIFLDIVDMHVYFKRQNEYGPVTFVINKNFLNEMDCEIHILKNNPIHWKEDMSQNDKYYTDIDEYISDFERFIERKHAHRKAIVIHDYDETLSFNKYLVKIIVDKMPIYNGVDYTKAMKEALIAMFLESGLYSVMVEIRNCKPGCGCQVNYLTDYTKEELDRNCLFNY